MAEPRTPFRATWVAKALAGLVLATSIAGCIKASVSEEGIYLPLKGAPLSAEAVARRAPAYTLEPQTVTTPDGVRLTGVLLRRPGADRTILYFGGNRFIVERGAGVAERLSPLNVNLMMVDYRGYGASAEGTPTVAALMGDAVAVFDHLAALPGMSPSKIIVHGHSLGSFMAGQVAAVRPTAGLVLEASATNAQDFARAQTPLLVRPLIKLEIAESLRDQGNLRHMTQLDEPMLLLVGSRDRTMPASMSQTLFQASTLPAARKLLTVVDGAGHNDVLHHPAAISSYAEFLAITR